MTGCERCGAQALSGEADCPVCGAVLRPPAGAVKGVAPRIPVRRHGKVPPPPPEILVEPGRAALSLLALGLGGLGAALIAGGVGYWLW